MYCSNCGNPVPDGSILCPGCGAQLSPSPVSAPPVAGTVVAEPSEASPVVEQSDQTPPQNPSAAITPVVRPSRKKIKKCKRCGGVIDPETKICASCGDNAYQRRMKIRLTITTILLVVAILAFLVQWVNLKFNELTYQDSIAEMEAEKQSLNDQIAQLNSQNSQLSMDSLKLDSILDFLQSKNAGGSSSKFKASDKIFVVQKNDTQTSFTLTCAFHTATTVTKSVDGLDGLVADVEFAESKWYGDTTKLYIKPYNSGTCTVTFSNSANTQTFSILIIVLDDGGLF